MTTNEPRPGQDHIGASGQLAEIAALLWAAVVG